MLYKLAFAPFAAMHTIRQFCASSPLLLPDFAIVRIPAEPRPVHVPVMPREVLRSLQLTSGLSVLDGTVGAGGHSSLILKHIGRTGRLIAMDRDPMMLAIANESLRIELTGTDYEVHGCPEINLLQGSYVTAVEALNAVNLNGVDRVLLDLGLSSDQLADRERGFGFDAGGLLDMRFNPGEGSPAHELLRKLSEQEISDIFSLYGEEPAARRIAAELVRRRNIELVTTTSQLEDCVRQATGTSRVVGGKNPATRVFQALRIAVNQELQHVEQMMTEVLPQILNSGGIAVILTFHSLEDRIVKTAFKGQQGWQILTKTPIEATPAEVRLNPRSRSAKLRAVQKL